MTVKIEVIEGGLPHDQLMIAGLVGSLVCIYLTSLNGMFNTHIFSFLGGFGAVCALIWGSNTIKVLCSYGIGTGVPSAGMLALGSGVIAMLLATRFGLLWAPIVAVVLAAIIGAILGFLANNVLMMKIPVMIRSITEMAVIGALSLMGFSAMLGGSFSFTGLSTGTATFLGMATTSYANSFMGITLIAVVFFLAAIAIQHPFNATLGPSWKQDRMLWLAAECGFLSMITIAVMSFAFLSRSGALVSLGISLILWAYTYSTYITLSKRDAAFWLDSKPIKEPEVH
jgi:tetrahydromethanopterin S-methyltransferase subunit C